MKKLGFLLVLLSLGMFTIGCGAAADNSADAPAAEGSGTTDEHDDHDGHEGEDHDDHEGEDHDDDHEGEDHDHEEGGE